MYAKKAWFVKRDVWKTTKSKKVRYPQNWMALTRIGTFIAKNLLVLGVFLVFPSVIYIIIAYIVMYLEIGYIANSFLTWNDLCSWYKVYCRDTTGYIPTLVVASASLLLTAVTMAQSHYSRVQDRAMEFPKNYVDTVSIGLNIEDNLLIAKEYFKPIEARTLIQFSFREGFSTYYKAYPYRLFVCLTDQEEEKDQWEKLKIGHFRCANLFNQDSGSYKMLLEGSNSKLLQKYCKLQHNKRYCMRLILDVRWTNNLVPAWYRKFSALYIREEIKIDRSTESLPKKDTETSGFSSVNKVIFTEHENSPLAALKLKWYCKTTQKNLKKEKKRTERNRKTLKKREREKNERHDNREK